VDQIKVLVFISATLLTSLASFAQTQETPDSCRQGWEGGFRADDYPKALEFFRRLQSAVEKNDRSAIAGMVFYPLRVSGEYRIHNRTAFLRHYDRIFDAKGRKAITSQVPECIFGNWRGFMAGNGEVWFERYANDPTFKVTAVNSESWPRTPRKSKK
jgi:hypothetical protein